MPVKLLAPLERKSDFLSECDIYTNSFDGEIVIWARNDLRGVDFKAIRALVFSNGWKVGHYIYANSGL